MKSSLKGKYLITLLSFAFLLLILNSCSSSNNNKLAPCVDNKSEDLVINWGNTYKRTNSKVYRSIQSNAIMFKIVEDSNGVKKYSDTTKISYENYCYIKQRLEHIAIKTQSMYYPADIQEFIEYKSNNKNISFRAFWNPLYIEHIENREILKSFYDSLSYLCN